MLDLLVDDRLEHARTHRDGLPCDPDLGLPPHHRAAGRLVAQVEARQHVHERAHTLALELHRGGLELALVRLLHVDLQLETAERERHVDSRRPPVRVVDVEALDTGHRLRHRLRVVEHLPHDRARSRERPLALDVHATCTSARERSGCSISSQTRLYGFQLSCTIASPLPRSASWIAAQTAWMPAPPPSPIPFVPSGVKGEALSM